MNRSSVVKAILEAGRCGWTGQENGSLRNGARRAAGFISLLPESVPAPAVVEGENGGLALEWHSEESGMLVIEFRGGGQTCYQVRSRGVERRGETGNGEELAKIITEAMSP